MTTLVNQQSTTTPKVSFETFGVAKDKGKTILVLHALTGNSTVAGEKGWWKELFGEGKLFDTRTYHIVGVNLPGNGYLEAPIENYKDYNASNISAAIVATLLEAGYHNIAIGIGGSLGGGILWDIVINYPTLLQIAIPIAADWKSTDWVKGFTHTQDLLLNTSENPIAYARQMAMFFYRNPTDFRLKFNNGFDSLKNESLVVGWLNHHGETLANRFSLPAYKMMNHLLGTLNATKGFEDEETAFKNIQSTIIQISISSDILFSKYENEVTKKLLDALGITNEYLEIESNHGHDAFLIEYEKITNVLQNKIE